MHSPRDKRVSDVPLHGRRRLHSVQDALTPQQIPHQFPNAHHEALAEVLRDFTDVFSDDPTPTTKPQIRLKEDNPFRIRSYRYSEHKRTLISEQVEVMVANGIIELSHSKYASPIVMVQKKNGQPRFCIDYRRLNQQTTDSLTPLPIIQDLGQANIFSMLDLRSGYWQIPMEESSKPYTAFTTPDSALYQFWVMPVILQRLMTQEVLPGYLHKFFLVYLDDIEIIY